MAVKQQIEDPADLAQLTTAAPPHAYDNWTDWETWEASPELRREFPLYRSGYDLDGLVGK